MDDTRHDERKTWRPRTNLVRGGTWRSEFGETCEAIYLTSGFVYDSAEQAKASFKNGVLEVTMPAPPRAAKGRRVPIEET